MKTLVIHPQDITTDFLGEIYKEEDWSVINENISKSYLKQQIQDHDRIIMLGHGSEYGLIGFNHYIIDSTYVYLLRNKSCVFIWCNADKFVEKYELKGFYTGMIISEVIEANMYNIPTNLLEISLSNTNFAYSIKESINCDNMLEKVKSLYESNSPVSNFNYNNLYFS
jgi:hypothetical protein